MPKVRLRIGFKLAWPITNVAIAVVYVPDAQATTLLDLFNQAKGILALTGNQAIADRLVCEVS